MSLAPDNADAQTGGPTAPKKPRSCVTCRSRKVRCDKKSPCSNCVKGGIECVLPSLDRPPRWARRLATVAKAKENAADPNAESVMERLRSLEGLVKDLSGKLEKANAAVAAAGGSPESSAFERDSTSPGSSTVSDVQRQMGRLVVGQGESRYVSSDFWTRINDEVSLYVSEVQEIVLMRVSWMGCIWIRRWWGESMIARMRMIYPRRNLRRTSWTGSLLIRMGCYFGRL